MQEKSIERQQLVHLNVGQTPFVLLRETIDRYPTSFIAQQVEKYSELVANGEHLFIDRNPKTFPWIAEIYRDGDIKGSLPAMSMKDLRKELRFYGLPPLSKLGIQSIEEGTPVVCSDVPPMKSLFLQILNEISRAGLLCFLPVDVFVYTEIKEGMTEGSEMKHFVVPHDGMGKSCTSHRDHGALATAIFDSKTLHQYCVWGKKMMSEKSEFWLLDFKDDIKLQLMNREAIRYDMQCTTFMKTYGSAGNELPVNILKIEYKAD